jgi:aminoglycoside phosphotransferase (APT) family kinase protein
VSEPKELREALAAAAAGHYGHPVEIDGPRPLLGGSSRELWSFDALVGAERHPLVLRRDPPGVEDPAAQEREAQALAAAGRHGVPVPALLWRQDGGGMVMQRLEGEAIARRILRDERFETARTRLVDDVGRAAAAVAAVPVDEVPSLRAAGDQVPGAPARPPADAAPAEAGLAALEAQLDAIGEPHPALELGLRWLRRNLPDPVEPALVHGDLRLGNLLVDESGLVAALDWELCHLGDPAEDLGWLCVRSWRFGHDARPALGCGTRDELLAAYTEAGGRKVTRDELFFWEAFGNVRWGIICLVQADVHLSGAQRSLERAAIGRRTCEPEWDLLAMID